MQGTLAQAYNAYCAVFGYEAALPLIDDWLAHPHPNCRRANTLQAFTYARVLKAQ